MGPLLICSNPQIPGGTKSSILEQFSQTVSVLCSDMILISAYRILHLLHTALHICFVGICKFSRYYKKTRKTGNLLFRRKQVRDFSPTVCDYNQAVRNY